MTYGWFFNVLIKEFINIPNRINCCSERKPLLKTGIYVEIFMNSLISTASRLSITKN